MPQCVRKASKWLQAGKEISLNWSPFILLTLWLDVVAESFGAMLVADLWYRRTAEKNKMNYAWPEA